ncbi:HpcH/HpaI aldolase/citrate lyase family protein [Chloroflexota bacterium]
MRENRVKTKMREGKLAIGAYAGLADPALVEIIGLAGFDAAFIDTEHSAFDFKLVEEMIRATDLVGITSIVRVPENNPKTILRILDMGAQAIQVPHIKNKEDAIAAAKAVRYAPLGERGMAGASRATRYGTVPMTEHMATSNSEILLIVMVEDKEALNELEGIASVDGVDLVAIGPADLLQALGISDSHDPRIMSTIDDISATLLRVGKAKMTIPLGHSSFPLDAAQLQQMGVAYTNCGPGTASLLLRSYRQRVEEIRAQLR